MFSMQMEDIPKAALRKAVRGPISSRHPRQYTRLLVDDDSQVDVGAVDQRRPSLGGSMSEYHQVP